jgi:hypothetical protein
MKLVILRACDFFSFTWHWQAEPAAQPVILSEAKDLCSCS